MNDKDNIEPKRRKGLFGSRKAAVVTPPVTEPVVAAQPEPTAPPVEPTIVVDDVIVDDVVVKAAPRTRTRKPVVSEPDAAADVTDAADSAAPTTVAAKRPTTSLLFQAPPAIEPLPERAPARQPRQSRANAEQGPADPSAADLGDETGTVRRRSRRRPGEEARDGDDAPGTVVRVRQPRPEPVLSNEPTRVKGSTRLEAKKQRRRDGRDAGRRRPVITESEFLARRESVDRVMVVRSKFGRIQIAVLEDGVLVEHYVAKSQDMSLIGNVYLGRVQNVLPSMEAAFVDIGRGRNAVLYSGEVDWDAANAESGNAHQARRIELALKPGDKVLVQVTKDPIGHKGARLTSQVSLPGRYLVYVPNGSMSGISRKLPDTERARLKKILKEVLPENVGVIVRTAAEGATEEQLTLDVSRLTNQWAEISRLIETANAPALLHSEPDLLVKIIRDVFNEDFHKLVIDGDDAQEIIQSYLNGVAPDLIDRVERFEGTNDPFDVYRVNEQIEKALDRKVWLPSGGSLVIDRTEAMTVVDVNTGKFVGSGGNLEETVTKNNLEAAEEIVRQLRLRDIGGIIVVDFIDMVLESNRDLVLRRLVECLSRDRTKHQVAEVTSLGLVQMTRKKLGLGLLETFSEPCEQCAGRGVIVHHDPVTKHRIQQAPQPEIAGSSRRGRGGKGGGSGNGSGNGQNGGQNNGGQNGNGNGGGQNTGGQQAAQQQPQASTPKVSTGTHAITDDARNALAQIAARTVTQPADAAKTDAPKTDAPAAPETAAETPTSETAKSETPTSETAKSETPTSETPDAAPAEVPAADVAAEPVAETKAPAARKSASRRVVVREPVVVPLPEVEAAAPAESTETVAILDIPVTKAPRAGRRMNNRDAEQILDSVLEALPEPKQPGQGRSRTSRRAGSAGAVVSAPVSDD
ncbi:ribonuclease E [Conyzicola lurida]|uniref:Ribonuclease E n=1 Tax=Conyzicola lurida TaxID=1172621 RepID=A0A841AQ39_9MICO|nr:ribonuclease E [Conyzicola lurida]